LEQDIIRGFSRQTIHGLPLCKVFSSKVDQAQTAVDKKFFVIIPLPSKIDSTEQHNVPRTSPASTETNFDGYCNEPENAALKTETICPQTDLANTFSLGGYSENRDNIPEDWMSMVDCNALQTDNTEVGNMSNVNEVKVETDNTEVVTMGLGPEVKLDMTCETEEPGDACNYDALETGNTEVVTRCIGTEVKVETDNTEVVTMGLGPEVKLDMTCEAGEPVDACNSDALETGNMEIVTGDIGTEVKVEMDNTEVVTMGLGPEVKLDMTCEAGEPVDACNSDALETGNMEVVTRDIGTEVKVEMDKTEVVTMGLGPEVKLDMTCEAGEPVDACNYDALETGNMELVTGDIRTEVKVEMDNTEVVTMGLGPEVKLDMTCETEEPGDACNSDALETGTTEVVTRDIGTQVKLGMTCDTTEVVGACNLDARGTVVTLTNQGERGIRCFQVQSRVKRSDANRQSVCCQTLSAQEIVKYNDTDPRMANRRSSQMQPIDFRQNYDCRQGKVNENSTAKCKLILIPLPSAKKRHVTRTSSSSANTYMHGKLNENSTDKCKLVTEKVKQDESHIGSETHREQNKRKADYNSNTCTSNERDIKKNKLHQYDKHNGIKLIIQKKAILDETPNILPKVKLEDNKDKFKVVERRHSFAQRDRGSKVTRSFYHCLICDKYESLDKDGFENHLEEHLKGELECEICGLETVDKFALTSHRRNDHSKEWIAPDKQLVCEQCGYLALRRDTLSNHMFKKHQVARSFACEVCKQMFESKTERKEHIQTLHPERLLTCMKCKTFTYRNKSALLTHLRCCAVEGNSVVQCSLCDKTFTNNKAMRNHKIGMHHKVRRFSCELCLFTSATGYLMKKHAMTHKGNIQLFPSTPVNVVYKTLLKNRHDMCEYPLCKTKSPNVNLCIDRPLELQPMPDKNAGIYGKP